MCKVIEERFNSQLGVVGANRSFIDMQFGKGFTKGIELGRPMSTDTLRRLSKTLNCTPEWLSGEDITEGHTASLPSNISFSGQRLKSRREQIGYSQNALANLIGKSFGTEISKYETKGTAMYADTLLAICHYLKCSIEYIQGKSSLTGEYPSNIPDSIKEKQKATIVTIQTAVVARHISESRISPNKFAKQVGLPRNTISKLRSGNIQKIPISSVKNICRLLHLSEKEVIIPIAGAEIISPEDINKQVEEQERGIRKQVYEEQEKRYEEPVQPKAEVLNPEETKDVRISLSRLAKVTQFAEEHPDLLSLFDQIADLNPDQISHIKQTIDLLIKGCIVS